MQVSATTAAAPSATRAAAPAATTAPPADPKRALDISRVPFKMMLEVKCGDAAMLSRKLSAAGWSASPQPADCSHNSEGCWHGGYSRIQGPQMTLADGGLDKIGAALDILRAAVGDNPGLTAAMRISVVDNVLDDRGTTNLVNMHLANEAVIYRLGQAGGRGRTMADKLQYCPPPSTGNGYTAGRYMQINASDYRATHANIRQISGVKSVAQWRKDLASYHWGMNASTQGFWEFRYFDSSFDVKAVQDNVKLLLGMIKAAQEDRGSWDTVRPLPDTVENEVPRRQWEAFVGTVAPEIKGELEKAFIASGGKLERDVAIPSLSEMIRAGWRFESESAALALEPLCERLRQGQGVEVRPPQSEVAYALRADQVSSLACAERGALDRLAPSELASLKDVQQIAQRGVALEDAQGRRLGAALAWVLSADSARVQARQGDEVVPLEPSTLTMVSKGKTISAALSTALDALPAAGARLVDGDGRPVTWDARVGYLYKNSGLFAARGDDKILVDTPATVRDRVLRPHLLSTLDAAQRVRVDQAQALEKAGYALHDRDGKRLEPSSLGWLEGVIAPAAGLQVRVPQSLTMFALTDRGLDNLARHIGGAAIDADLQDALAKAEALRAAGCSVPAAVDTLPALTAEAPLRWTDPLGNAHSASGAAAFRETAGAQLEGIQMNDGQREALGRIGEMMNEGQIRVRMPSQAFVTSTQQVPWLISSQAGIEVRAHAEEQVTAADARPAALPLKGWSDIERFVAVERDPATAGATGAILGKMRAIGCQIYPVAATRKAQKTAVPMTLNSAALQSLDQSGLRLRLPSWTFWKGLPRRTVVVHGGEELARLGRKFD